MNSLQFDGITGIPMTALYVPVGGPCQFVQNLGGDYTARFIHEGQSVAVAEEPLLEFYQRIPPAVFGEFTGCRYYVGHLLENRERFEKEGLVLHVRRPRWTVSVSNMRAIMAWLEALSRI